MTLINTAGMSFIGPGSEWFWTALGVIIAAVTLLGIYRQLRLQLGAGAIEQMETINQEFQSEQMSRARLAVLLALRDGADPAKLPPVANDIANFWERVGYLVRAGHVDRVAGQPVFRRQHPGLVGMARATTHVARERDADPALYENFEWLAGLMAEMDRKVGKTATFDEANRAILIPLYIERNREVVRIAEESRAVLVRPLSTASLTPDPAPSPAAD